MCSELDRLSALDLHRQEYQEQLAQERMQVEKKRQCADMWIYSLEATMVVWCIMASVEDQ